MSKVTKVTGETLAATVAAAPLAIIDFTADWCPPCRMMHPIYQAMAEKYGQQVVFVEVDSDESPDLIARYGIQSLPTFAFLRQGEIVKRIVGSRAGGQFEREIQQFLTQVPV